MCCLREEIYFSRCMGTEPGIPSTASCTYEVRGSRMELFFWKKLPVGNSNRNRHTRSQTIALCW
ncbi:hypothetical protein JB92DRAFT_2841118 [Gautieria morchelliformis]|nr:hypothetical protein JB92DRAFT_2841118 [Gautieria morchelliformis]